MIFSNWETSKSLCLKHHFMITALWNFRISENLQFIISSFKWRIWKISLEIQRLQFAEYRFKCEFFNLRNLKTLEI